MNLSFERARQARTIPSGSSRNGTLLEAQNTLRHEHGEEFGEFLRRDFGRDQVFAARLLEVLSLSRAAVVFRDDRDHPALTWEMGMERAGGLEPECLGRESPIVVTVQ